MSECPLPFARVRGRSAAFAARGRRALVGIVATLGLVTACSGTRDAREPGEALGTFVVTGKLVATTCGKADPTFRYEVRLSREGSTLYWLQGASPVSGSVDANAKLYMVAGAEAVVERPDTKAGIVGCTLHRTDTLAATLRGEPISAFDGAIVYKFETRSGDCAAQLEGAGGDYAEFPCTMTYDVNATLKGSTY
jgi:hypothetical protein